MDFLDVTRLNRPPSVALGPPTIDQYSGASHRAHISRSCLDPSPAEMYICLSCCFKKNSTKKEKPALLFRIKKDNALF